jgi:hypothetical protein
MSVPRPLLLAAPLVATALALTACSSVSTAPGAPDSGPAAAPVAGKAPEPPREPEEWYSPIHGIAVPAIEREVEPIYRPTDPARVPAGLRVTAPPKPASRHERPFGERAPADLGPALELEPMTRGATTDADFLFASTVFDDNATFNGGPLYIPPDNSSPAAGPDHVVTVVNTVIRMHNKTTGSSVFADDLQGFFSAVSPATDTFDPKILYDRYEDRYVAVTLEKTGTAVSGGSNTSLILLGVSATSDPTGTWYFTSINAKQNLSGTDYWADYPGFAVDEEAVYVTGNLFTHVSDSYGGTRLWIVDKGTSGGFYDGGSASFTLTNPYLTGGSIPTTTQPAEIHPDAPADPTGTFLVSYSGLTDGSSEYLQILLLEDPLGTPTFSLDFVSIGNIEDTFAFPDAPQSGSAETIETNDQRALQAVYSDKKLWTVAAVSHLAGNPEVGQVSAFWARLSVSTPGSPSLEASGTLGGEDIATGTFTFFPAVAVNPLGHTVIGFSASDNSIFPGAYFVTRDNAGGSFGSSMKLKEGEDWYLRKFSGTKNRWGDYSGAAVDPEDGCIWLFNQWAMTRGTETPVGQDGRWATSVGKVCMNDWIFGDDFSDGFDRWTSVVGGP